jgi:hypothetical protein
MRRAVIKASDERYIVVRPAVNQHDEKQAHNANDDAEHPQPTRRAGVGRRISHAGFLSSQF